MSIGSERVKRWRKRNPEKARDAMAIKNARFGGYTAPLSPEANYPRPKDGKCRLCQKVKKLHRDHCHETGAHRGWLCIRCNTMLGNVEAIGLNHVHDYLEGFL